MSAPTVSMLFAAAGLVLAPPPGKAFSPANSALQPIGPWVVNFADAECYAERTYGTANDKVVLGFGPVPTGDTFELLVGHPKRSSNVAQQLRGSVQFDGASITARLLRYGMKSSPYTVDKYRIDRKEMDAARSAATVTFHNESGTDERFALSSLADVLAKLDECNESLRHYWNMTDAEKGRVVQPARGNVRRLFSSSDYPKEAFTRAQGGGSQFLLFVTEKGDVAACHVLKASGVPSLDGMACQVIVERARFSPARDVNGHTIRTSVVTPPIVWQMDP